MSTETPNSEQDDPSNSEQDDPSKEVSGKAKVVWDPLTSSDWDNQKPNSEAIVRIKR